MEPIRCNMCSEVRPKGINRYFQECQHFICKLCLLTNVNDYEISKSNGDKCVICCNNETSQNEMGDSYNSTKKFQPPVRSKELEEIIGKFNSRFNLEGKDGKVVEKIKISKSQREKMENLIKKMHKIEEESKERKENYEKWKIMKNGKNEDSSIDEKPDASNGDIEGLEEFVDEKKNHDSHHSSSGPCNFGEINPDVSLIAQPQDDEMDTTDSYHIRKRKSTSLLLEEDCITEKKPFIN